jgi:glycosyltransferase involved in cell wall biosynthesis
MTLGQATDNTAEIAQEATARNSRIRALIHGPREGRTLSVNLALSEISGE